MADILKEPDIHTLVLDPEDIERILGFNVIDTNIKVVALCEYSDYSFYIGENKGHSCLFWFFMEPGIGNRGVRGTYVRFLNLLAPVEELIMMIDEYFLARLSKMIANEEMEDVIALNEAGSHTPMPGYAFIVVSVH